jgi:protein tyrosine phosphatase (PTP) superfamily phosphohydrolase (DUF442 family)
MTPTSVTGVGSDPPGPSFSGFWHYLGRLMHRFVPHFRVVSHGVLYRSGQPRGLGLQWVRVRGIRTLVNLRSPESSGTAEEQAFAERHGLHFHNIHVGIKRNRIATSVDEFLQIIGDPGNYPVLVHCSRGKERSGVMSAIYRIEQDRWPNERALEEMYRLGVSPGSIPVAEDFVRSYRRGQAVDCTCAESPAAVAVNWQE